VLTQVAEGVLIHQSGTVDPIGDYLAGLRPPLPSQPAHWHPWSHV
jgi:hypothetical protein